jgi:hypothetical protein
MEPNPDMSGSFEPLTIGNCCQPRDTCADFVRDNGCGINAVANEANAGSYVLTNENCCSVLGCSMRDITVNVCKEMENEIPFGQKLPVDADFTVEIWTGDGKPKEKIAEGTPTDLVAVFDNVSDDPVYVCVQEDYAFMKVVAIDDDLSCKKRGEQAIFRTRCGKVCVKLTDCDCDATFECVADSDKDAVSFLKPSGGGSIAGVTNIGSVNVGRGFGGFGGVGGGGGIVSIGSIGAIGQIGRGGFGGGGGGSACACKDVVAPTPCPCA